MGRVARYKKIRKCDPFAKGGGLMANDWGFGNSGRKVKKRSKTAERLRSKKKNASNDDDVFDAAPDGKDDFDLTDFMVKKQEPAPSPLLMEKEGNKALEQVKIDVPTSSNNVTPVSLQEEKKDAKILKIDLEEKKEAKIVVGRMEGESKKAFNKRMKTETKRIIRNEKIEDNRNPEKKQRKKDFMNEKKKKKKGGATTVKHDDTDMEDSRRYEDYDMLVTGERALQQVAFGEQAQRPPEFKHLPRGATPKNKANIKRKPGMSAEQQHAESRAMEQMRAKVQAQYAIMKKQRKQDGDFHL